MVGEFLLMVGRYAQGLLGYNGWSPIELGELSESYRYEALYYTGDREREKPLFMLVSKESLLSSSFWVWERKYRPFWKVKLFSEEPQWSECAPVDKPLDPLVVCDLI
jgi:hypothetical protein